MRSATWDSAENREFQFLLLSQELKSAPDYAIQCKRGSFPQQKQYQVSYKYQDLHNSKKWSSQDWEAQPELWRPLRSSEVGHHQGLQS